MRVGLFGGSFNPPHIGHSLVCFYLLQTTDLEQLWLIPTYRHAFGKPLAPYAQRLSMCAAMAQPFGHQVHICDIERTRGHVSYTIDTVRALLELHPEHAFEWIIGADVMQETARWKDFDQLSKLVPFRVLGRKGYPGGSLPEMPQVSSTEIRQRLTRGASIEGLVTSSVLNYIREHQLYTCNLELEDESLPTP